MTEKALEQKLARNVIKMGGLTFKFWPVSYIGLPDRIILWPGGLCDFIEVKGPKGRVKKHQEHVMIKFKNLGFVVEVIQSDEQLLNYLSNAITRIPAQGR